MAIDGIPPRLEETHEVLRSGPVTLLVRRDWRDALPVDAMLAGAPLTAWGAGVDHGLRGRGEVHVLATSLGEIVAKTYSRGGVIGGLLRHSYGDPWRPAREAAVAERLIRRGCATPPVVAARATRLLATWRLEIATARVAGARDLLDALREARGPSDRALELARGTGLTLRRLHDVGLHHRDLQVKNLLVDEAGAEPVFHVIDLDRCHVSEPPILGERCASLARFGRSLVKQGLLPRRGHSAAEGSSRACRAFVDGYGALGDMSRGQLLAEVVVRLRRSLRTHQWLWRGRASNRGASS